MNGKRVKAPYVWLVEWYDDRVDQWWPNTGGYYNAHSSKKSALEEMHTCRADCDGKYRVTKYVRSNGPEIAL